MSIMSSSVVSSEGKGETSWECSSVSIMSSSVVSSEGKGETSWECSWQFDLCV